MNYNYDPNNNDYRNWLHNKKHANNDYDHDISGYINNFYKILIIWVIIILYGNNVRHTIDG